MISDTMTTFSPLALRRLSCRKGSLMDDAQQSSAQWRDDLRVLGQEIAALGSAPLPSALLEEIAGVTLLHAEGIVNTVRVPLVVLDATLHVLMANRYFYECFQVTPLETESHRLYDLGNGQWNLPALLMLLTIEDITARRRAEAALRQQRALLAVTLSSIGDAVMATDPHGRVTF